jgi:trans-2-enoyl-CoA reductase
MNVLHILKSEPDELVEEYLQAFADEEVTTVTIFEGEVDWEALVDEIFTADKVISWW